jgi:hypothetical protein
LLFKHLYFFLFSVDLSFDYGLGYVPFFSNFPLLLDFLLFFFKQSVLKSMERISRCVLFILHVYSLADGFLLRKGLLLLRVIKFSMRIFLHQMQVHDHFHFIRVFHFFPQILFVILLV